MGLTHGRFCFPFCRRFLGSVGTVSNHRLHESPLSSLCLECGANICEERVEATAICIVK